MERDEIAILELSGIAGRWGRAESATSHAVA